MDSKILIRRIRAITEPGWKWRGSVRNHAVALLIVLQVAEQLIQAPEEKASISAMNCRNTAEGVKAREACDTLPHTLTTPSPDPLCFRRPYVSRRENDAVDCNAVIGLILLHGRHEFCEGLLLFAHIARF
eukprot:m.897 g.897  ORF g.897 m.897 type:complete len:130 (+) comp344_c0_seq1:110-499(+)